MDDQYSVKNFKVSNIANKHLMLLKRLDEEEGLIEPSIEEKLKSAEDRLRYLCEKFCEDTSTLLDSTKTDENEDFEAKNPHPEKSPDLYPQLEIQNQHRLISNSRFYSTEIKGPEKLRKSVPGGYCLSPASWFSCAASISDLSNEEIELLSSCATKAFVKFLEEKRMEIPNIFSRELEKTP